MVCLSLSERLKLKHLGQKLQEKTSSLFFQPETSPHSVYLGRHWHHSRDKIDQAFPLRFFNYIFPFDQKLDSGNAWEQGYPKPIIVLSAEKIGVSAGGRSLDRWLFELLTLDKDYECKFGMSRQETPHTAHTMYMYNYSLLKNSQVIGWALWHLFIADKTLPATRSYGW